MYVSSMDCSFIILLHSCRLDNLEQMLRFFFRREPHLNDLKHEFIFGVHDKLGVQPNVNGSPCKVLNMNLDKYHRTLMINRSVEAADGRIVVILDGDRVMSTGYFVDTIKGLKPNTLVAPRKHYLLPDQYTDEQIDSGRIKKIADFRNRHPYSPSKNAFSGNTIMTKDGFRLMGGMDEEFWGYGFADNDASLRASKVLDIVFDDVSEELHLYHLESVSVKDKTYGSGLKQLMLGMNCLRFYIRWDLPPDMSLHHFVDCGKEGINTAPPEIVSEFNKLMSDYGI